MRKASRQLRSYGIYLGFGLMALVVALASGTPAWAQTDAFIEITTPGDGELLNGVVEVRGTASTQAFLFAELAFAYADEASDYWFGITEISQPVTNAQLALWDTNTISDGMYRLRLRLNGTDGTVRDDLIHVQVRNYTSAPTAEASAVPTSQPVLQVATPLVIAMTPTVARSPVATPTPLLSNPASLTRKDVLTGFSRGGLAALAMFLLWGAMTYRRRR